MINARPQTTTLVSFGLFLIIAYVVVGFNTFVVIRDPRPQWFNYLIVAVLLPIAFFVTYKVFFRYKVVRFGDGLIEVNYPQLRVNRKYPLSDVVFWMESSVKTGNTSSYKELEIAFKDGRRIQMGHREFTEYTKILNYLSQKLPGSRKSTPS